MQERKKNWIAMEEYERWLEIAADDLKVAELLLPENLVRGIVYHCQQAAEKALKGYLAFQQQEIMKTHDLTKLLEACWQVEGGFLSLREAARFINPYATKFRYPTEYDLITQDDAELSVKHAKSIVHFVIKKIKEAKTGQKTIY